MANFDPYAALGVSPEAPDFIVQAAYRACLKKYHPDVYKGADSRQRTADTLEAYRILSDPRTRANYDAQQGRTEKSSPPASPPPTPGPRRNSDNVNPGKPTAHSKSQSWPLKAAGWIVAIFLGGIILGGVTNRNSPSPAATDASPGNGSGAVDMARSSPTAEVATSAASALPMLEDALRFTDPSSCAMAPATQKLFGGLIRFDPKTYVGSRGGAVAIEGFPAPLTPTFKRTVDKGENRDVRDNEATLALTGIWHGLKVSKIRARQLEESSFWEYQIRFVEPPSKVRDTLNRAGFVLPPVGDYRKFSGESEASAAIGVEEIPGGAALYCGSSIYY